MDARSVCPDELEVRRYIVGGKPSIATFADMFRYRMIRDAGCCWVDTDFVCLTKPAFPREPYVFCRQADAVSTLLVNNAVLRLPASEPALMELIETAENAIDVDQKWGALGPFLLTPVLEKHGLYEKALDPHVCYPIEPEQFWKPFLPTYRARGRSGAHRGDPSSSVERSDKVERLRLRRLPARRLLPPRLLRRAGALDRFNRIADEDEVRRLMAREIAACEARAATSAKSVSG